MADLQSEFEERVSRVPIHGVGLSVDVYSPDLFDLDQALVSQGIEVEYLEIFHASLAALESTKRRFVARRLAYHGEGLWITQADFCDQGRHRSPIADVCAQLHALGSAWLNIECATKQMAGYSFGSYLPPLYTALGARVAAENLREVQRLLDQHYQPLGIPSPLLLVEIPPLTYFVCGSLPIPRFFAQVTRESSCGLVLDIGHLWTVYRYSGTRRTRSLERFLEEFLAAFPLERVVEIHVAGLETHNAQMGGEEILERPDLPRWIDAHGTPIPAVLFDMLEQVLASDRLTHLKGIALEVDTKSIPIIVSEFRTFRTRFGGAFRRCRHLTQSGGSSRGSMVHEQERGMTPVTESEKAELSRTYQRYARVVSGQVDATALFQATDVESDAEDLAYYRDVYLPDEILHWGGDLRDMFPQTDRLLTAAGVDSKKFVTFWFSRPRVRRTPYDFFLLKIEYYLEFVSVAVPSALEVARREADELRTAYDAANQRMNPDEVIR